MSESVESTARAQLPAHRASVPSEGRKLLPSIPSDTSMAAPRPVGKASTPLSPSSNGYGPFFQEYTMMAEYANLPSQKLPGIYVLPSHKSPLVWNGVIFIREGLYQDGVFRFYMTVPENYPDGEAPAFRFEFPVFHPMVNPETGEIDVKRAFPHWRKNVNHLSNVLLFARRIFYKVDTSMPLNPEAATLYEREPQVFQERVAQSIQQSRNSVLQPPSSQDPYTIRFSSWDPGAHEAARQHMLKSKVHFSPGRRCGLLVRVPSTELRRFLELLFVERGPSDESSSREAGLSWMKVGSTQIFSRDDSASA